MQKTERFISKNSDYLEEIRKKLVFSAFFFLAVFLISFFLARPIIRIFLKLFNLENVQIIITSPFQFFGLSMNLALFLGIILVFPIIIYQTFIFLKPALTKNEIRNALKIVLASILLFCLGFSFGFAIMYYVIGILAKINNNLGVANMWDINFFISQILLTAALLGVLFQFPIVLTILMKIGIIDVESLRKKRSLAVASSFIVSSLLPPTDALSLIIMALPLVLIFELTIFLNRKRGAERVEVPRKKIV